MTSSRGIRVRRGTRQIWLAENQGRHFCHCGCGEPIPLKAEHFNVGVPHYLHGHNAKVRPPRQRKVPLISVPCDCGCGDMTTPGRRFVTGHNGRGQRRSDETRAKLSEAKLGERNPNFGKLGEESHSWKGGLQRHTSGYLLRYCPEHPFAVKRYIMEHRLIYEQHLRETDPQSPLLVEVNGEFYLRPEYDVHHKDEVKDHNAIDNLEGLTTADHTRLHRAINHARVLSRKEQP